jgi:hypothetical protein
MARLDQNPIPYLKPMRILTLAFVIISNYHTATDLFWTWDGPWPDCAVSPSSPVCRLSSTGWPQPAIKRVFVKNTLTSFRKK